MGGIVGPLEGNDTDFIKEGIGGVIDAEVDLLLSIPVLTLKADAPKELLRTRVVIFLALLWESTVVLATPDEPCPVDGRDDGSLPMLLLLLLLRLLSLMPMLLPAEGLRYNAGELEYAM